MGKPKEKYYKKNRRGEKTKKKTGLLHYKLQVYQETLSQKVHSFLQTAAGNPLQVRQVQAQHKVTAQSRAGKLHIGNNKSTPFTPNQTRTHYRSKLFQNIPLQ